MAAYHRTAGVRHLSAALELGTGKMYGPPRKSNAPGTGPAGSVEIARCGPDAEFQAMVAKHEIHYYAGRSGNSFGGGSGSSTVASWVAALVTSETAGGVTACNLTQGRVARQVSP